MSKNKKVLVVQDSIMENEDIDIEKKRKRENTSSVSSALDTSTGVEKIEDKQKKKKKKKGKQSTDDNVTILQETESQQLNTINKQLKEINVKLSNVYTKDDGSLRDMIKCMFQEIKEDMLQSVYKRIDILEGKLFEKETENETLKKDITTFESKLENQKAENEKLKEEIHVHKTQTAGKMNEIEQYSRINNIRIDGIEETENEEQYETERKVVKTLNSHMPKLKIKLEDVEIGHRLGNLKDKKPRQIIIQFCSRNTKTEILKNRKLLKGTGIFVNEDLTRMNQHVFTCIRKKSPDEVESTWTRNGTIFYKNKMGSIHRVNYNDYQSWIDLPWPVLQRSKTPSKHPVTQNAWLDPVKSKR